MITLRIAEPRDASGIAAVHIDTWRDTYAGVFPVEVFRRMTHRRIGAQWSHAIASRSETVLVAEDSGGRVVGFGSCGATKGLDLPYQGEVYTLYVHPDFQGQAVGRRLMASLFGVLADKGMGAALIWVLADNPARFFYQAMGGALVAERRERLWGVTLREAAYGWADVKAAIPRIAYDTTTRPGSD
jgi:ribosomal protein S18 acetylase RimI-like enzyme